MSTRHFRLFLLPLAGLLVTCFGAALQAQDATERRQANNVTKAERIKNWLANQDKEGDGPWQEYSSMVQAVVGSATPTVPRIRGGSENDVKKIAPMTYVSADAPPFLLVHEESDRVVNVRNSGDFVKALREAGAKDVTYMRYEDGSGHGTFQANIKETGPARAAFFERTLRKKK